MYWVYSYFRTVEDMDIIVEKKKKKILTWTHCGDSLGVHVPSSKHNFSALPTNS